MQNFKLLAAHISIHAPSRERLPVPFSKACIIHISIHAPSRERPLLRLNIVVISINFNPRSLAGATVFYHQALTVLTISIHAPSRERRFNLMLVPTLLSISIHAPSRERQYPFIQHSFSLLISIHAPSRERHRFYRQNHRDTSISIHAPSRERPLLRLNIVVISINFNPRSLAGATL